jgi:hypothetical protein
MKDPPYLLPKTATVANNDTAISTVSESRPAAEVGDDEDDRKPPAKERGEADLVSHRGDLESLKPNDIDL